MTLLFSVTASGSVLIVCIALLRALCRRHLSAGFYRALWMLAAARLLLFWEIPSPVSIFTFLQKGADTAAAGTMTGAWHAVIPVSGTASTAPPPACSPLFFLWITGTVLLAAAFLVPHLRFCLRLRHAAGTEWEGRRILIAPFVGIPCAVGLISPAVCLPKVPMEYAPDALACILAHENAHIRRGDILVKWLFAAALSVHWFNPLVWLLYVLACRDVEFACDEAVIRRLGGDTAARVRYASVLLDQMDTRTERISTAAAISDGTKNTAKERILRMIQPKKTSLVLVLIASLLCAAVTAVFAAVPAGWLTDDAPSLPAEDLVWSPPVPTETLPLAPTEPVLPETDSVTLIFPLPADSVWEMTAPFGSVAYLPQKIGQNDPPFYFLARIPDNNGKETTVVTVVTDHDGVDLAVAQGTDVLAVADGTVLEASYDWLRGIYVIIDCGGVIAEYRHLEKYEVSPGDTVSQGDVIAHTGYTGAATGPHLHFSLIVDGEYVDPMAYYTPAA